MPRCRSEKHPRLDPPDLGEDHELRSVLSSALRSRGVSKSESAAASHSFWLAEHFNLDGVAVFRGASEAERADILEGCGRALLEEAYWIEQCGMYFASKMSLMAGSAQERMLFSLFAADEAIHFSLISEYVAARDAAAAQDDPFIKLLGEVLRSEDKVILTYMVQVVLEGWGVSHYQSLARDCKDARLAEVFDGIIKDEARHHATGLILFNQQGLSSEQFDSIVELMSSLLFLVQAGPQSVVARIERVKGRLSKAKKRTVFEELQCEADTAKKLETLKGLIRSAASADAILERLDHKQAFKPFSASRCAEVSG